LPGSPSLVKITPCAVVLGGGLLDRTTGRPARLYGLSPVITVLPTTVVRAWVEQNGLDGARAIAPLLPAPVVVSNVPTVPELTEFVLDHYGDDEEVFEEFCAGAGSGGVMSGDIAGHYDRDAEVVRRFLTHRCRWVREWARRAESHARDSADWFRVDDEEFETP